MPRISAASLKSELCSTILPRAFSVFFYLAQADKTRQTRRKMLQKLAKPKLPAELDFESVQAYKAAMRLYDAQRIANGEATPEQVQKENDWIEASDDVEVFRFPEAETTNEPPRF